MKGFRIFFIGFLAVFFLVFLFYFGWGWYIQLRGVELHPESALRQIPVSRIYLQSEPDWRAMPVGKSGRNMQQTGELPCVLAMSLEKLGLHYTPAQINRKLDSAGLYNAAGDDIRWKKIGDIWPNIAFYHVKDFNAHTIQRELEQGKLTMVMTKESTGKKKWLLLNSATAQDFLAIDPARPDTADVPLSPYGRVYAYRVLFRME